AASGMTATRLTRVEEEDGDRENPFRPGGQLAQEAAGFVAQSDPASPAAAAGDAAPASNGKESQVASPRALEDTVRLVTTPAPGGGDGLAATEGEVAMALNRPEQAEKVELGGSGGRKGRGCCLLM
ncbi:hypothetical protein BOX15_Mlig018985g2, partial [Macrostomum lignano]